MSVAAEKVLHYWSARENSVECSGISSSVEFELDNNEDDDDDDEKKKKSFTEEVTSWIEGINARGFPIFLLRKIVEENEEEDEESDEQGQIVLSNFFWL